MLSCNCLNVIIESETNDFQVVSIESLNLTEEEKTDSFFKQELKLVDKLSRISKEHSGLVISRNVGNWILHQCLNCDVETHAIHRDRGAGCVLVSAKLLTTPSIASTRNNELYSKTFNIVVQPDVESTEQANLENLKPDVQLALGGIKQRMLEVVNKELAGTEERVCAYSQKLYQDLEKFKTRALKEHKALTKIILEKRNQPLLVSSNYQLSSPPKSSIDNNVPLSLSNTNLTNDKMKNKTILKTKVTPGRAGGTARQMSTPLPINTSLDSEGLFQLEEMEDGNQTSYSEQEESDNEDHKDVAHVGRNKSQPSIAKSLPVNIPVFMSPVRNRSITDEHEDMLPSNDLHPSDIAASIKALAKSVHGDTVFGDLPRPRFSTQI